MPGSITAEPYYLLCFDKKTGKVRWIRSNSWYDANKADLVKKGDPKVKALEDANGKLQAVLGAVVKQMNAGIAATGAPGNRPILTPATLAEKQKAEQALAALVKDADADFGKRHRRPRWAGHCWVQEGRSSRRSSWSRKCRAASGPGASRCPYWRPDGGA